MRIAVFGEVSPPRCLLTVDAENDAAVRAAAASEVDALVLDCSERGLGQALGVIGDLTRCYVRLGPLGATAGDLLDAVVSLRPRGILLSGATGGADVTRLAALLRPREALAGIADGATRIIAVASATPESLLAAAGYAGASARLAGLVCDVEALAGTLGARATGELARHARMTIRLAAAAAGLPAFETARKGNDLNALRAEAESIRELGFAGMLVASADQVPVINAVFSRKAAPSR